MTSLPTPEDAWRIAIFLQRHQWWSVFWDKKQCATRRCLTGWR
jgi:hypothetical protein